MGQVGNFIEQVVKLMELDGNLMGQVGNLTKLDSP